MATNPARSDAFASILKNTQRDAPAGNVRQIPLQQLRPNPDQPRKHFAPEKITELADNIRKRGVLQPILVRPIEAGFEIIAGERRYRAAQQAGLTTIPAVIREADDSLARELALIENLNRQDLNPIEETQATLELLALKLEKEPGDVLEILREGYYQAQGRTTVNTGVYSRELEVAHDVFHSLGRVTLSSFYTHRLPLLNLPNTLQQLVARGQLEYSKAKLLASVTPPERRDELVQRTLEENLSRADLHKLIAQLGSRANPAPDAAELNLAQFKRRLTPRTIDALKPAKQKKLLRLLRQLEALLED